MGKTLAYKDTIVNEEYMEFLRWRLVFLRELLADHGSIYLHIDYKIGHYVKILMDEIFGRENFRNDIARIKCNPKNFRRKGYGNIKDMILFYTKTDEFTWNDPKIPLTDSEIETKFTKMDDNGRRYNTVPVHAPGITKTGDTGKMWRGRHPPVGRHWRTSPDILDELDNKGLIEWSNHGVPRQKKFADEHEGKRIQDIWEFKDPQYVDYPTEKNYELLKQIIRASSNEGDTVLDCFCGSGTTLLAAKDLNRQWIGIDSSSEAIRVAKKRLDIK